MKRKHFWRYLVLFVLLGAGFFLRVYRVGSILGFYFDQGRDALIIWDLWHKGEVFLVGPTTGIAGIFRGPFYYYLIAPFYLLGGGDPVWPAVFLAFTTTLASALSYYLGKKIHSVWAGIFAVVIFGFSFNLVIASRWLSNPTPMMLLSMILVWLMVQVAEGRRWAWPGIAFVLGLSLFHFGSSGEFFYFPAVAVFLIWQRKNFPSLKQIALSVFLFLFTAAPLILFDIRHDGILSNNIVKFFNEDKSFRGVTSFIFNERMKFYWDVFTNKIFHWRRLREVRILVVIGLSFLILLPRFFKNTGIKILILLFASPLIGFLFFQGNFGNVYDYYLTGYYLIFVLLFAIVLAEVWKSVFGKVFVIYFFWVFLTWNLGVLRYKVTAGSDGPETIVLRNQKQAVSWVYWSAGGREFNVDVYVPPVIPYAYDYLFRWYPTTFEPRGASPSVEQIELLYTLYEVDPPHPERLEAWKQRQEGIGEVEEETRYGGIVIQRRKRISDGTN